MNTSTSDVASHPLMHKAAKSEHTFPHVRITGAQEISHAVIRQNIGIIYFRDQIQGSFTAGRPFKLQLQSVG